MKAPPTLLAAGAAMVLLPSTAGAATLATDQPCYLDSQPMTIAGTGWPAGAPWSVKTEQVFDFGTADPAGNFTSTNERAPIIPSQTTKPKTFTLTGSSSDQVLATTTFRVVNFLVKPQDADGNPSGRTKWSFSGFFPRRIVYVHVRKGGRTWTQRVGRASAPCGTLSRRLRRLPAVPPRQRTFGTYRLFVDNRRTFSKGGLQYQASITIFRTFGR